MKMFQALQVGLESQPIVVPYSDDLTKYITDNTKDWYVSLYQYTEAHKKDIEKRNSFKGIKDTTTDRLFFDLDCEENVTKAQEETILLIQKLIDDGIDANSIQAYFSGMKGFSIQVDLTERINPDQFKAIIRDFCKTFDTLDVKIVNPVRIVRIPNTKHPVSGLFKIPLDIDELLELNIEQIKALAKKPREWNVKYNNSKLPESYKVTTKPEPVIKKSQPSTLDFSRKPKDWRNCKWSLLQGEFGQGKRDWAMMVLAATCRGLGFDEQTAFAMCRSALERSWSKFGEGSFSEEELENNVIKVVYDPFWKGGQYSCKNDLELQKYCNNLGEHKCADRELDTKPCLDFPEMFSNFLDYAKNFESNIIKTEIPTIDNNVMFCASTLTGLLGAPGAGKTSFALNFLHTASKNNIPSIFLSLDMGMPLVFSKLIQRRKNINFNEALALFKNKPQEAEKLTKEITAEYKNVGFNFKSGLSVNDIRNIIIEHEKTIGKRVKLLVIDYLECLSEGNSSDPTVNSGMIANKLKDLANEFNICILLLLQTQKHATPDISDALLSPRQIKGSSLLEQSMSMILTLWREGYNPKYSKDDNYISFAVVKNRFGSLWHDDFHWEGKSGGIRELTMEEDIELQNFRERKKMEKQEEQKERENVGW